MAYRCVSSPRSRWHHEGQSKSVSEVHQKLIHSPLSVLSVPAVALSDVLSLHADAKYHKYKG